MRKAQRLRLSALLILLLSLLLRAAWIARFPANAIEPVDAEGYHLIARNILAGNGFSMMWEAPFCPTALRTPLYPLFLAGVYRLLGAEPERAVLVQLLLEVLSTALVIQAGTRLGGRRSGTLAGLLYACNGSTQRYTGVLFAETLLLTGMTAALTATLHALQHPTLKVGPHLMWGALSGALWGLTLLIKPNVQFLAPAAGVLLLAVGLRQPRSLDTRKLYSASGASFAALLLLMLLPWLVRNQIVFKRGLLSTAYEENLARVSAVATLAEIEGIPVEPWTPSWEALYNRMVEEAARRYAWSTTPENALPCLEREERRRDVSAIAREVTRAHPEALVRSHLRGIGRSLLDLGQRDWYRALTGKDWEQSGVLDNIWKRMGESLSLGAVGDALQALWLERVTRAPLDAAVVWWGLLALRALVWWGAVRGYWRLRHVPAALLLGGIAMYGLVLAGPIAHDRFYLPAIPAVVLLLTFGIRDARRRFA
ncbi:MAG: glycosyltransferase family 39 protein [Anaerolineae bacterium]|nr:glycosyltransferase family 39 protein [Anaerolineae bacterium]